MARGDLIDEIFEYIRNHRGEDIKIDDICRDLGRNRAQVQQTIGRLQHRNAWPIQTLISGRWWKLGVSPTNLTPVDRPPTWGERQNPTQISKPQPVEAPRPVETPKPPEVQPPTEDVTLPTQGTVVGHRTISPRTRPEIIRKASTEDQATHLFEYMGARPNGKLLLRRDDGKLFEATLEQL